MADSPRAVLDHVIASITPASAAQAAGARHRLAASGRKRGDDPRGLVDLAARLAAARHAPAPRTAGASIAVCAADHGVADPGVDLGDHAPGLVAIRHVASGEAAVCGVARTAGAQLVLVDCGIRGGETADLGPGVIALRLGDGTADITQTAAMTPVSAVTALQQGIALSLSLADGGVDVLALGQLAPGAQPVSAALTCALTGAAPADIDEADRDAVAAALDLHRPSKNRPLDVLAALGGFEIGVLAGLVLGAASIHVPVVLDDHGTSAAALLAAAFAPDVGGYLVAAHGGNTAAHRLALGALGLEPVFALGLSHGEGAGSGLALPVIESAAQLLRQ